MTIGLLLYYVSLLGITLLLVQSLNLIWRVRLFSLGHHGFFGLGAYVAVMVTKILVPKGAGQLPVGLGQRLEGLGVVAASVLAGFGTAFSVAWVMGRFFRRVRGDYFAVATLIFAEIIRGSFSNISYVGGGLGFEAPYLVLSRVGEERILYEAFYSTALLMVNILVFAIVRRIDGSVYGLYLSGLKEDCIALEHSGVDVVSLQSMLFSWCCGLAGAAGAMFLHFTTLVVPGDFSFVNGLPVILAVAMGGLHSSGCVMAAAFIYIVYEGLKNGFFGLLEWEYAAMASDWKDAILGLILVVSVVSLALRGRRRQVVRRHEEGP